jgi:AraC-like DNA-binding protein
MKTLFDLLFILNGTLGLVCVFLVGLSARSNRNVNGYLAILLLAVSIRLILRGYFELSNQSDLIASFSNFDLFLIGIPLPYLYFRNLAVNKSIYDIKDIIHFILPVVLTIEYNSHFFGALLHLDLTNVIKASIILTTLYYLLASLVILMKSFWRKRPLVEIRTEQEALLKKWTIVLFIAFVVNGVKLNLSILKLGNTGLLSDNFIIWFSWLVVFMMILTSPSILNAYISQLSREGERGAKPISFWRLKPINTITNPKDIQLSKKINGELNAYFLQITQSVEEKHLFRKSDMTINELALKTKIPISHLGFIFKYHSEISFLDYRKMARIQDAVALIEEGFLKINTLDALSEKVGFNTYNSFYIGFKEFTGKAPQNYVISLSE